MSSSPSSTVVPPSPASSRSPSVLSNHHHHDDEDHIQEHDAPSSDRGALHPRVAVILGVDRKWYVPLLVCRALSVVPAAWWGLRCAFTFLAELLRIRVGMWREGWAAAIVGVGSSLADWDVERRFRVTEVALAIMWVCKQFFMSDFLWLYVLTDVPRSAVHPRTYHIFSWTA